ncbi:MAG: Smr/MutS family protein [Treponema sp.]|jgi:DNA-nicking Smr family endonuclease|nr:Smr/MutS family protein [Treponema sp.]
MDFGDIYKKWERHNSVTDKDSEIDAERTHASKNRRYLRAKKADATLDLHGLSRDDARSALEVFFENSRREAFDKVLIVHGKGNHSSGEAILKRTVQEFIERCPYAGESGQSRAAEGGSGATWVLLK